MRPLPVFLILILLIGAPASLGGQTTFATPALDARLAPPIAMSAEHATGLGQTAARRRPWWALPAGGAAVGGALGAFVSYRECQNDECIGAGGLAIVGAGAGAIIGLLIEGGMRALR